MRLGAWARIKGRTDDMLVIKGVNVYPSQLEMALLTLPGGAPHCQPVVDRGKGFPIIEVHVEPADVQVRAGGGLNPARPEVVALSLRVGKLPRAHLGLNPEVTIVPSKPIPRSEGKAVRVVERSSTWVSVSRTQSSSRGSSAASASNRPRR